MLTHKKTAPKHDLFWHLGNWVRRRYEQQKRLSATAVWLVKLTLPGRLARKFGSPVTLTHDGRLLGSNGTEIYILQEVAVPADGFTI